MVKLVVLIISGSQCWYFSHEPSSLFHQIVVVDLSYKIRDKIRHSI